MTTTTTTPVLLADAEETAAPTMGNGAAQPPRPPRPVEVIVNAADAVAGLPRPSLRSVWRLMRSRTRMIFGARPPLSTRWGLDRGLPAHRLFLEHFLQQHAIDIRGACLEFQDPLYVQSFGGGRVERCDVIHLDNSNPHATLIADITKVDDLPADRFDCIVCTHVLHTIFEVPAAIAGLHRMLRPGGVLLAAVPMISMCDPAQWEMWRFTPRGLHEALGRTFGHERVRVHAFGNSFVAAGEMRGLIATEFSKRELIAQDERFAVEVCARAVK